MQGRSLVADDDEDEPAARSPVHPMIRPMPNILLRASNVVNASRKAGELPRIITKIIKIQPKLNPALAERAKELATTGNYDELIFSKFKRDAAKVQHQCRICGYDSFHRNAIIRHMRTHTGETPFKCGYCTYSSSQKANLMRHLKQHAGGRQISPKEVISVQEEEDAESAAAVAAAAAADELRSQKRHFPIQKLVNHA